MASSSECSIVVLMVWLIVQGVYGDLKPRAKFIDDNDFENQEFSESYLGRLEPGVVNKDIDRILYHFNKDIKKQVAIPDIHSSSAYGCYMTGLDDIRRKGNALLSVDDNVAHFYFGYSTGTLTIECNWKAKVVFFTLYGTVAATTKYIQGSVNVSIAMESGAHPQLKDLEVDTMAYLKTDIRGVSFLKTLIQWILDLQAMAQYTHIRNTVQSQAAYVMKDFLHSFSLSPNNPSEATLGTQPLIGNFHLTKASPQMEIKYNYGDGMSGAPIDYEYGDYYLDESYSLSEQ